MKVGTDGVLLGAWAHLPKLPHSYLLDIGTGCGLIALMLAQRSESAEVLGVEIDEKAVVDAQENVNSSPFSERVRVVQTDVLHFSQNNAEKFDLIVSNPPYYEEDLICPDSKRAQARHTQGGGLTFAALIRSVDALLNKENADARFCVILPSTAAVHFVNLAQLHSLHLTRRTDVVTRPTKPSKRTLLEFSHFSRPLQHDVLCLVGDDGQRSESYRSLCADFYL